MKVKVELTLDIDYIEWAEARRRLCPEMEVSPAACRRNIVALAEEAIASDLDGYVGYEFVN
jgi:hypothetical protein